MKKVLNLQGVSLLSKDEQKNVLGGKSIASFEAGDDGKGYQCCLRGTCSECRTYGGGAGIPYCSTGTVTEC